MKIKIRKENYEKKKKCFFGFLGWKEFFHNDKKTQKKEKSAIFSFSIHWKKCVIQIIEFDCCIACLEHSTKEGFDQFRRVKNILLVSAFHSFCYHFPLNKYFNPNIKEKRITQICFFSPSYFFFVVLNSSDCFFFIRQTSIASNFFDIFLPTPEKVSMEYSIEINWSFWFFVLLEKDVIQNILLFYVIYNTKLFL